MECTKHAKVEVHHVFFLRFLYLRSSYTKSKVKYELSRKSKSNLINNVLPKKEKKGWQIRRIWVKGGPRSFRKLLPQKAKNATRTRTPIVALFCTLSPNKNSSVGPVFPVSCERAGTIMSVDQHFRFLVREPVLL